MHSLPWVFISKIGTMLKRKTRLHFFSLRFSIASRPLCLYTHLQTTSISLSLSLSLSLSIFIGNITVVFVVVDFDLITYDRYKGHEFPFLFFRLKFKFAEMFDVVSVF